jgi:hypothetical protein
LNLQVTLKKARRRIASIAIRNKKMLFLGILLASIIIGIVGATVCNSMRMQGDIGVESIL